MEFALLLAIILAAFGAWYFTRRWRASHRQRLRVKGLPVDWVEILERRVPIYRAMPGPLRVQLHGLTNVFLDEKEFIGCNGLEITDEMRAVISAQACMLLLNRETDCYPGFQTIYVYPGTYLARQRHWDGLLEIVETDVRAGEAWHRGPVVLSWEDVCVGTDDPQDGFNVVLHEFAHKLDEENDRYDGLPVLDDPDQYSSWAKVLGKEFGALRRRADRGEAGVIDEYGAESPSEFFAVVTEAFFERPKALHREHPALYEQFRKFYRLDPKDWTDAR